MGWEDRLVVWGLAIQLVIWGWGGAPVVEAQGYWETVVNNAGISTMHSAVAHDGNVVLLDRTNVGPSQLKLAPDNCRDNLADRVCEHHHIFGHNSDCHIAYWTSNRNLSIPENMSG